MNAKITLNATAVEPGEAIHGQADWQLDHAPEKAEVRLFWQTRGKGTSDSETVAVVAFDLPQDRDERTFSFSVPEGPPSFSGTLVSLVWGVELVIEPGGAVSSDLVVGPGGVEIQLDRPEWLEVPDPLPVISFFPSFS